jgi:TatA/E family protein of Tat protein translocase
MGSIGIVGLLILAFAILLIFGAKWLPAWGRSLGEGMRGLKDEFTSSLKGEGEGEEQEELQQASPPPAAVSGEHRPEREHVGSQ